MRRRHLLLLLVPIAIWIGALLQRAQPLTWDEIEFFRASRWIAEGQVPYRDFWEHHTPLQWFVFAPAAKLFGGGIGAQPVLNMRWAQLPFWIGTCALLLLLARRVNMRLESRLLALLLLLGSRQFVADALQFRVDTVSSLAFIAGLALAVSRRWIAFGVVMSAAVLANVRLAPLVIVTALLVMFFGDERWRWNPRALRMLVGVAIAVATFLLWLFASGAWAGFVDGVFRYNGLHDRLAAPLEPNFMIPMLLAPLRNGDVAGIALWLLALAGAFFALREIRKSGVMQLIALLFVASIVVVAMMAVKYEYHLQLTWLLMVPLAASAIEQGIARLPRATLLVFAVAGVAIAINLGLLITPSFGNALAYQDRVMTEVHERTKASDAVWDGTGYALHRRPAYRQWFLPAGMRLMVQQGLIAPYDIERDPPAAIVFNYRIYNWLNSFPKTRQYALHHYVPLYRNLWLPGLSAALPPGKSRLQWRAAADGVYDVWASPILARHPWIARPMEYGLIEGPDAAMMEIPLERLPRLDAQAMQWVVDGVVQPRGATSLSLRKGARVELRTSLTQPAGVLVVPRGIRTVCKAPEERFVF
jgi:4-amino-4-deoxy-L-arabinose transferase-like glycosyltransferase